MLSVLQFLDATFQPVVILLEDADTCSDALRRVGSRPQGGNATDEAEITRRIAAHTARYGQDPQLQNQLNNGIAEAHEGLPAPRLGVVLGAFRDGLLRALFAPCTPGMLKILPRGRSVVVGNVKWGAGGGKEGQSGTMRRHHWMAVAGLAQRR